MSTTFMQGLEVMGYGLLGVFGALVALYFAVILLGKIPEHKEEAEN